MPSYLTLSLASVVAFLLLKTLKRRPKTSLPLPPGPKGGWPLIGNLLQMPRTYEHETYQRWCKETGSDIIHLSVAGQSIVILDKYEDAIEILDKRSGLYSSRPEIPMLKMMGGWDMAQFAFSPYGDEWRRRRRLFHQVINEKTNTRFYPLIKNATNRFLYALLEEPEKYRYHVHCLASSAILRVAYGLEFESSDPHLHVLEKNIEEVIQSALPGAFLVNILPFLQYIPNWFPGAGFKGYAEQMKKNSEKTIYGTYRMAVEKIDNGDHTPSFVFDALQSTPRDKLTEEEEEAIISVALSMYGAGADTTASVTSCFILAMALHPLVQQKAQNEIQRIFGPDYIPSFEDAENLPYVTAVVLELFRWVVPVPTGVPHYVETDDIYENYLIPGGSIVIANIWSMLHDEEVYPNPDAFMPERFIKDKVINTKLRDPRELIFGFGRRVCPGKHMAYVSAWTAIARILACFDINATEETAKALPEEAKENPTRYFESALILHPVHFKCSIKPRSPEVVEIIRRLADSDE